MERDLLNREINNILGNRHSSFAKPNHLFKNNQKVADWVVLKRVETVVPHLNKRFIFSKKYDKANAQFANEIQDEWGNKIDLSDFQQKEFESTPLSIEGKIHPTLKLKIANASDRDPIDIAVWLNLPMKEPLKTNYQPKDLAVMPTAIANYRTYQAAKIKEMTRQVTIERSGIRVERISELLPLFFAKANKRGIEQISTDSKVLAIFFNDKTYREDLSTSLSMSGAKEAQDAKMTALGKDIKVAVWESAPDVLTNLTIEGYFDTSTPSTSSHSRLVSSIIKNKESGKPKGYAPNCKLYSANNSGSDLYAPIEWAVQQGCTVINQSFHQDTDQVNAGMQLTDYITDAMALIYPYPTFVQASGNTGQPDDIAQGISPASNEYVNHKGYNSIKVGSHNDQATRQISAFSTFRNPSSPRNDRELPEICALGENISAVGLSNWGGTSFSSPAVAGAVALLQSIDVALKFYPEACRALLLAGSKRNVDSGVWYEDLKKTPRVDQKDGTGALNIYESITIAKKPYPLSKIAQEKGWDKGRLDASSFGSDKMAPIVWKIKVPYSRKRVKIALAWNSVANYVDIWIGRFLTSTTLDMDLDILVYDDKDKLVANSMSFDNSYEIAEYLAKGGETLTVKIMIGTVKPGAWSYFGLAWTTY